MNSEDPEDSSLDPEEIQVLRDAGIFSSQFKKGKSRHIVFVDDEETGTYL